MNNGNWIRADGLGESDCPLFYREIPLRGEIKKATVRATAIGIYNIYINERRVGDALFAPGWTSYHNRLQYQTYEVTELISGETVSVGIHCAPGWAVGFVGHGDTNHMFFDHISTTAEIELEYKNGEREIYVTDENY